MNPTKTELLECDIDARIHDLWQEAFGIKEWTLELAAAFMRAAYGKGYCDSLKDERGELLAAHGYRVPA